VTRAWYLSSRWLPQGWLDALRQLVLFAGAYYLYRIVRGLVDGQAAIAFDHARDIVSAERAMGLFFEPGFQDAVLSQTWLRDFVNFMYVNSHFMITTTFLIWLYLARNHAYYYVRNMFMIAMGLALALYAAYPTAPPRLLPEWGFTDTVAEAVGPAAQNTAEVLYNPYAAVPSMHVGFALMIAIPAMKLVASRAIRVAWAVYPALVTFVVVVTANHFWLDAALGAAVAGVAAVTASAALGRARPEAWAWRSAVPAKAAA
jgi:PAP2 superfamily